MSSHEIVVDVEHIERLVIARPSNRDLWEDIETLHNGRHALVLGSLDDALVMPGTLDQLERVAQLITDHVGFERERVARKAAKKAARKERKRANAEVKREAREAAELNYGYPAGPVAVFDYGPAGDLEEIDTAGIVSYAELKAAAVGQAIADGQGGGGFIKAILRPGADLEAGGEVPVGQFAVALDGGIELVGTGGDFGQMGDHLGRYFSSRQVAAVTQLAETFDNITPGMGTGFASLTCTEADDLARMFIAFGHFDSAANVIAGHCDTDDSGDAHGYINALAGPSCWEPMFEAAHIYVQRLDGQAAQPADADEKRAELAKAAATIAELEERTHQIKQELGQPVDL